MIGILRIPLECLNILQFHNNASIHEVQSHSEIMNIGENSYAGDRKILRNFDKDVF